MNKDFGLIHELRLSGVDWSTIKDSVDWFTDNDRKVYSGWLLGKEQSDDSDIIKNAKTLQTIRVERKRLGIERSINNEQIRDITLHKTFTDQVIESIKSEFKHLSFIPRLKTNEKQAHIFTTADLHHRGYENTLQQLERVYDEISSVILEQNLEHIYLLELGDIVEGATLRTSQLMGVKSGIVTQTIEVAKVYTHLISELSKLCSVTFISVDSSNHTQLRNLGTKQNQLIEEDMMLVFNGFIRKALPKLEMITGEDVLINILGFNFFMAHGHLVKSKEKYLENLQMDRNINIDYGFFAHYHHMRDIDLHSAGSYDKRVFYVPSISPDTTSYEKDKNLSSVPGVGYYVFEENQGWIQSRKLKL